MKRKKETEKLDPAFERCQHCGEVYFKTDGKATKSGFVCVLCVERGLFRTRHLNGEFGAIMKKQRKTCKDCGICQPFGEMGKCHFGGGFGAVVALHNRACKMFVPTKSKEKIV